MTKFESDVMSKLDANAKAIENIPQAIIKIKLDVVNDAQSKLDKAIEKTKWTPKDKIAFAGKILGSGGIGTIIGAVGMYFLGG